jgi:branched-chain amino acid transport system ATP-binding protein
MAELIALDGVVAGYGEARVLRDVTFDLDEGAALALLGRNGTGKTTLVNTIMGLTRLFQGRIRLAGADITRLASHRRAAAGLGWVPQERNIFASLTVEENLTAVARPGPWTAARVFELFPRLAERRGNYGNQLSGGEQQMLALGRALVLNPKLLLLDEPLEGLAPIIVEEILAAVARLIGEGRMSVVIVEQNARKMLRITSRALVLERGRIVYSGTSAGLAADAQALERLLGVARATAAS